MSINPYESPKVLGSLMPRDRPFVRSIIRGFTLLVGIISGTTLAMTIGLTIAFLGNQFGLKGDTTGAGLIIGGSMIVSIIFGALFTLFVHANLSRILLRFFGVKQPTTGP